MKSEKSYKFQVVAIAGTFDRLHKGHHFFISEAFKLGERVIIGVTSDTYVSKFKILNSKFEFKLKISNFKLRKKELEEFLKNEGLLERTHILRIDDVYGPAIKDTEIEAVVVTEETYEGGVAVNRKREELGLFPLKLLKLPMILAQDNNRIASTRIRVGEIDRWGKAFAMQIPNDKLQITNELRMKLKKPLGKLIIGNPDNLKEAANELKKAVAETNSPMIITVGDEVTKLYNEVGIAINLAIIDFRVHREEKYHSLSELGFKNLSTGTTVLFDKKYQILRVSNPPGHITKELVDAVKNAYLGIIRDGKQRIIQVDGEEDLAGVPAVLLAPLGALVLYGQPDKGVVLIEVTEEKKKELLSLITKFQ